ncbi:AlpA family transcriptional regulator [Magnetospira sp. QH-2]|uniref:helix-turn-helix transcriptional regulator n=1 Tax=Magnetospira sp. (strain QH-2) TaxID=1288970 RepID=UPI0003E812BB
MRTPDQTPSQPRRLMLEAEVAEMLAIKTSTLRRWRWEGKGPKFRKIGEAVRYHPDDVEEYVEAGTRTSTSQKHLG